jgi:hypothetical protein
MAAFSRSIALPLVVLAVALAVGPVGTAWSLPPGRSWALTEFLEHPRLVEFNSERLDATPQGLPLLISAAKWDTTRHHEWCVFTWKDSAWTPSLFSQIPATYFPEPVIPLTPTGIHYLTWISFPNRDGFPPLLFAEIYPQPSVPETAAVTRNQSSEYGGAFSTKRRWVVRSQQRFGNTTFAIRTLYSDTTGIWRELPELGLDEFMCTIAPLSDYSAMVVHSAGAGLLWAEAEGNAWVRQGVLDPRGGLHPRLRVRPSGGLWAAWTDRRQLQLASYRNGEWSSFDSTRCAHAPGETYVSAWCSVSQEGGERPVVAWGDLGYGFTYRDIGCVAFPTETGWSQGEEIPLSDGLFLTPRVTMDRNGDAWFAWGLFNHPRTRYTHTYVSATSSTPIVKGTGRTRMVVWTLSEPAPESWWTVLRAQNKGSFEEVARVKAGSGVEMSWTDSSPGHGNLRYKIRRESVDTRYLWESEEASWPPKTHKQLTLMSRGLIGHPRQLELTGAEAGTLEVRVHDVQGRVVWEQKVVASGSGRDLLDLDLASRKLGAGIYFATARDAAGSIASPIKLVVLR